MKIECPYCEHETKSDDHFGYHDMIKTNDVDIICENCNEEFNLKRVVTVTFEIKAYE
jgi:transcription elongation factor Elf1